MSNISDKWNKERLTEGISSAQRSYKMAKEFAAAFEKDTAKLDSNFMRLGIQIDDLDASYRQSDPKLKDDMKIRKLAELHEEMNQHLSELRDLSYRLGQELKKVKIK